MYIGKVSMYCLEQPEGGGGWEETKFWLSQAQTERNIEVYLLSVWNFYTSAYVQSSIIAAGHYLLKKGLPDTLVTLLGEVVYVIIILHTDDTEYVDVCQN